MSTTVPNGNGIREEACSECIYGNNNPMAMLYSTVRGIAGVGPRVRGHGFAVPRARVCGSAGADLRNRRTFEVN